MEDQKHSLSLNNAGVWLSLFEETLTLKRMLRGSCGGLAIPVVQMLTCCSHQSKQSRWSYRLAVNTALCR